MVDSLFLLEVEVGAFAIGAFREALGGMTDLCEVTVRSVAMSKISLPN